LGSEANFDIFQILKKLVYRTVKSNRARIWAS
jgi:hypothetical protein